MKQHNMIIGFDRKIRLSWLDAVAEWVVAGESVEEIRLRLGLLLEKEVAGSSANSASGKTKTVLLHIWVQTPPSAQALRNDAIVLLQRFPDHSRLAFHWGLCLATYPFFQEVVETIGRLLNLQENCTAAQIQRRLKETFGERETVTRATQRVIQSLVDWKILQVNANSYLTAYPKQFIKDQEIVGWLIESALMHNAGHAHLLSNLFQSPVFFPFSLEKYNSMVLSKNPRLEFFRQGLDQDMVRLCRL